MRFVAHIQDPRLLKWASDHSVGEEHFEQDPEARCVTHGLRADDGSWVPLAVCVFNRWTEFTVDLSIASDGSTRWASREYFRAVYDYAFEHAGKTRINMLTRTDNAAAISMHEQLGHVKEGMHRDAFGSGADAYSYGFTKTDYQASRWQKNNKKVEHGKEQRTTST